MTIESIFLLLLALSQGLVLCGALCTMFMTWCCIRLKRTLSLFKRLTVMDCDCYDSETCSQSRGKHQCMQRRQNNMLVNVQGSLQKSQVGER